MSSTHGNWRGGINRWQRGATPTIQFFVLDILLDNAYMQYVTSARGRFAEVAMNISAVWNGIIDWQIQGTRWRKNRMTTHFWHAVPWEGILHGWLPSQLQYPIPFLRQTKNIKQLMRSSKGTLTTALSKSEENSESTQNGAGWPSELTH